MKTTLIAARTNGYEMFVSVTSNGTIRYAVDGEIDIDLHDAFETPESAVEFLNAVEDDSAFPIWDGEMDDFFEGVEIIAEIEKEI